METTQAKILVIPNMSGGMCQGKLHEKHAKSSNPGGEGSTLLTKDAGHSDVTRRAPLDTQTRSVCLIDLKVGRWKGRSFTTIIITMKGRFA